MKGSAIIAAMILIVIGSLVVGGYLSYMGYESQMTKKLNDSIKAFYLAEAGLQRALRQTYLDWYGDASNPDPKVFKQNSIAETTFGGGTYTVSEDATNVTKTITSTGKYNNETRLVNFDIYVDPDFDWSKQVIGSCGGTGSRITGNVRIMGSVYILGEEPFVDANENSVWDAGESFTDINGNDSWGPYLGASDYAFEMGGSSMIGNNYNDMDTPSLLEIKNKLPSITNEDGVETLDASCMVKYGKIGFSGDCGVGLDGEIEDSPVNTKKAMDLVNIPDDPNPPLGYIYTDELLADRSRFNEKVRMPSLNDAYTDRSTTPATFYPSSGGGYEAYLMTKGLVIPGNVNIKSGTAGSYIKVVNGQTVGKLSWTSNGAMAISGLVIVDGSLTISRDVSYTGKGTVYVKGIHDDDIENDVSITAKVLTSGNFPSPNILGIMSKENIFFGGAQNSVMGLFYAANTIKCTKQYDVAGSFISTYFDMGTNVPRIFQVPAVGTTANHPPYFINTKFPGKGIVFEKWYESYGD